MLSLVKARVTCRSHALVEKNRAGRGKAERGGGIICLGKTAGESAGNPTISADVLCDLLQL